MSKKVGKTHIVLLTSSLSGFGDFEKSYAVNLQHSSVVVFRRVGRKVGHIFDTVEKLNLRAHSLHDVNIADGHL